MSSICSPSDTPWSVSNSTIGPDARGTHHPMTNRPNRGWRTGANTGRAVLHQPQHPAHNHDPGRPGEWQTDRHPQRRTSSWTSPSLRHLAVGVLIAAAPLASSPRSPSSSPPDHAPPGPPGPHQETNLSISHGSHREGQPHPSPPPSTRPARQPTRPANQAGRPSRTTGSGPTPAPQEQGLS